MNSPSWGLVIAIFIMAGFWGLLTAFLAFVFLLSLFVIFLVSLFILIIAIVFVLLVVLVLGVIFNVVLVFMGSAVFGWLWPGYLFGGRGFFLDMVLGRFTATSASAGLTPTSGHAIIHEQSSLPVCSPTKVAPAPSGYS